MYVPLKCAVWPMLSVTVNCVLKVPAAVSEPESTPAGEMLTPVGSPVPVHVNVPTPPVALAEPDTTVPTLLEDAWAARVPSLIATGGSTTKVALPVTVWPALSVAVIVSLQVQVWPSCGVPEITDPLKAPAGNPDTVTVYGAMPPVSAITLDVYGTPTWAWAKVIVGSANCGVTVIVAF